MSIASYESFRRWVREKEDDRSLQNNSKENPVRKPGRPRTPDEIRGLVIKIRKESNLGYNDGKFQGGGFDRVIESSGATIKRTTLMSPNLRAHVERVIQTLKFEVLDHFVIVAPRHLNRINQEAMTWYNQERPHSTRDHLPPGYDQPPEVRTTLRPNEIVSTTRLGGLLRSYTRRAA